MESLGKAVSIHTMNVILLVTEVISSHLTDGRKNHQEIHIFLLHQKDLCATTLPSVVLNVGVWHTLQRRILGNISLSISQKNKGEVAEHIAASDEVVHYYVHPVITVGEKRQNSWLCVVCQQAVWKDGEHA